MSLKKVLRRQKYTKVEPCHSKIIQSLHGAAIKPEIRGPERTQQRPRDTHCQTFYKPRWQEDEIGLSLRTKKLKKN